MSGAAPAAELTTIASANERPMLQTTFMESRNHWRMIFERIRERPKQEEHDRQVYEQLQESEAHKIACAQPQHSKQRQHPERIDEVRQRLGSIVDLHGPAEMHLEVIGGLHHVRRFQQPLAATGGNEKSQNRRVDTDEQRI